MDAFMAANAPRFADIGVKHGIYILNHIHTGRALKAGLLAPQDVISGVALGGIFVSQKNKQINWENLLF